MSKMWTQIGGDMNPGKYGGLIARRISGGGVELREIISVIEMSEYEEAMATGYPFFSRDYSYSKDELLPGNADMQAALRSMDIDEEDLPDIDNLGDNYWFALADVASKYGINSEEGPSGFAKDVVPGKVRWWSGIVAGPSYLRDEDREYRAIHKDYRKKR